MWRSIRIVSIVLFCFAVIQLGRYVYSYKDAKDTLDELQREVQLVDDIVADEGAPLSSVHEVQPMSRTEKLQQINRQIVGWIQVEGTAINNPIMQAGDNDFYLDHNHLNEKSRSGSIFLDYRNDARIVGKHTILYGHVMRDGTMFGQLPNYANQQFLDAHPTFEIELMGNQYKVEIFSAYETTTDFYYIETVFPTKEAYATFLQSIRQKSIVSTLADVVPEDDVITLSTCTTSTFNEKRFVIHGKMKKIVDD